MMRVLEIYEVLSPYFHSPKGHSAFSSCLEVLEFVHPQFSTPRITVKTYELQQTLKHVRLGVPPVTRFYSVSKTLFPTLCDFKKTVTTKITNLQQLYISLYFNPSQLRQNNTNQNPHRKRYLPSQNLTNKSKRTPPEHNTQKHQLRDH